MKRKKNSIAKIQTTKSVDFAKRILLPEAQIKIKGGGNPWFDGP